MWFRGPAGARVCAHDFGGAGDLLIIAHAAGFCGGAYAPVAATLSKRFRVWAVDLRGHGDTALPPGDDFAWEGTAEDVLTVKRGLDSGPAILFGHSLGGGASLRAAALAPESFSAVYAYEPAVLPHATSADESGELMGRQARRRRAAFASRADAIARLSARVPYDTLSPAALESFARYGLRETDDGTVTLKCSPQHEQGVYEAAKKITVEDISGIDVPVILGVGGRENGPAAQAVPLIAAALPVVRTAGYPRLGHLGPLEDPGAVATDALRHLAELAR